MVVRTGTKRNAKENAKTLHIHVERRGRRGGDAESMDNIGE